METNQKWSNTIKRQSKTIKNNQKQSNIKEKIQNNLK